MYLYYLVTVAVFHYETWCIKLTPSLLGQLAWILDCGVT